MARQTTTTMISTFLVRSLIHDFPKRSTIALAVPVFPSPGHQIPQQGHLAEHQRLVLLLRANDLAFRAKSNGAVDKKGRDRARRAVLDRAGGDSSSAQW